MTKTKKRIGAFSLITSIVFIVTIAIFFGEIFSFAAYINGKADADMEGLAIFAFIALSIYGAIALVVCAVPTLIFSIVIMKKDKPKTLKTMSILSAIFQFLGVVVVGYFSIVFVSIYPDFLMIWYAPVVILAIVSGILALVGCRKFKSQPQV